MFGPFGPFGIRFDWPEFFVGLGTGLVFALALWRLRAVFGWGLEMLRDALGSLRSGLNSFRGRRVCTWPARSSPWMKS